MNPPSVGSFSGVKYVCPTSHAHVPCCTLYMNRFIPLCVFLRYSLFPMYFSISVLLWFFHVVLHQLLWQACDTYEPSIASAKDPINFFGGSESALDIFLHIDFLLRVNLDTFVLDPGWRLILNLKDHHSSSVKFDVLVVGWKGSETPLHQMWPPLLYVTMISKEINFLQDPPQIEFCLFSIIHCHFCYLPGN